jgi:hypothetical protein
MKRPLPAAFVLHPRGFAVGAACCLGLAACGGTLDAGSDRAREELPFGPDNPVILTNDNVYDNWYGEYAVLLAHAGGPTLAGIVVSTGSAWVDLDANVNGWQELVSRARESGLTSVPDPVRSAAQTLRRPSDGRIESTVPNDSDGARFIVETSLLQARPGRPVVVATGGRLTDVADAYLIDPSVADRIIVSASIGSGFSGSEQVGRMGVPNGEEDPWADTIVIQKLRYVQVSARYDQLSDVPSDRLSELPETPLGDWMRSKQPEIFDIEVAADQVSVIAAGIPAYVKGLTRISQSGWEGDQPTLAPDSNGSAWLVTASDGGVATARLWQLLLDPATFSR